MKSSEKGKILCILQLAPPLHGASLMNGYLVNSEVIKNGFELDIINLQFNKTADSLKKFSAKKLWKAVHFGLVIVGRSLKFSPDLVYFNLSTKGFAFYRDACYVFLLKLLRVRILFHLHSKGISQNIKGNPLKRAIYRRVFNHSDVICLAESLKADIRDVFNGSPYVVPNGIPELTHSISSRNYKTDAPTVLFLSNYMKDKGVLLLVEALALLKNERMEFSARLVGAPIDISIEMLNTLIKERKLSENVTVTGPKYNMDKIHELQEADIFVLPSFDEAFPLVLLEAMRSGIPLISTIEGGIPDMVTDQHNGLLVKSRDTKALAGALKTLLTDSLQRRKLGDNGYETFMKKYLLTHFEHKMVNTFNDIIRHDHE